MPNYQQSKIYKLICNTTKIYIGSTTVKLCRRLTGHVNDYKKGKNVSSKHIISNDNYSIVLIEDYPCDRKEQLLKRERFYIESMNCLNKVIPTRTRSEYYMDNKENIKQYKIDNKENIKQYYMDNKEKKKEYYHQNIDKIKERKAIIDQCPICNKSMKKVYNQTYKDYPFS